MSGVTPDGINISLTSAQYLALGNHAIRVTIDEDERGQPLATPLIVFLRLGRGRTKFMNRGSGGF